jgi:hypothetical protein
MQGSHFVPSATNRVQEMASEFPHAQFISLDLVPMIPHVPRPNITFEVYDLYAGLAEPDESFDIIHARDCINSVSQQPTFPGTAPSLLSPHIC